jgi:hypothetical protein
MYIGAFSKSRASFKTKNNFNNTKKMKKNQKINQNNNKI